MLHDHERLYAAVLSRDRRFDGRFFTGVLTTGIYCRPVCPARAPKKENVRFYPCAAAAEEAGFRPCKRCRPESSPGSPAWCGTSATVARAVRLIERGALDAGSIEDLAARLGIGGRHLRRLFLEQLGVAPVALAQTRRLHLARRLLVETDLPVIEVALGAGFQSLRRFNDAFRKAYGAAPTSLRKSPEATRGAQLIRLRLPWRDPYDAPALLDFIGPRAIPGVEQVDQDSYRRTIRVGQRSGILEVKVRPEAGGLELILPAAFGRDLHHIVPRVREMFDLEAPVDRIADQLSRDPLLEPSIRTLPGLRLPGSWDPFELAVRAVLGQQVSVAAATTLAGRLVALLGEPLRSSTVAGCTHLFPTPETLAGADLRRIGLPGRRAGSLAGLARAVAEGRVSFEGKAALEETLMALRSLPGIGDWTAHYIAMRGLGEPDAFPAGDLGLRKAIGSLDGLPGGKASEEQVTARAEDWRPFRAYGAMHLWRSL